MTIRTSSSDLDLELLGRVKFLSSTIPPFIVFCTGLSFMPGNAVVHTNLVLAYMAFELCAAVVDLSRVAFWIQAEVEVVQGLQSSSSGQVIVSVIVSNITKGQQAARNSSSRCQIYPGAWHIM
jgi:hypothetical protein